MRVEPDGDGVPWVVLTFPKNDEIHCYVEDEPKTASGAWKQTAKVLTFRVFDRDYSTAEGLRPGSLLKHAPKSLGAFTKLEMSEIEAREFATFSKQPKWLLIQAEIGAGDFPGETVPPAKTTKMRPNARVLSLWITG